MGACFVRGLFLLDAIAVLPDQIGPGPVGHGGEIIDQHLLDLGRQTAPDAAEIRAADELSFVVNVLAWGVAAPTSV